jgi:hypothetical protein
MPSRMLYFIRIYFRLLTKYPSSSFKLSARSPTLMSLISDPDLLPVTVGLAPIRPPLSLFSVHS